MKVNKKEAAFLHKAISSWSREGKISPDQEEILRDSIEESKFDWQSLAFYAFVLAIASIIISGVALLADKWLMQLFETIVDASEGYKAAFFAVASSLLFYYGHKIRNAKPDSVYSHTALTVLGVLTSAVSLGYLTIVFGLDDGHNALMILFGVILYGFLAIFLNSQMLWIAALIGSLIWFGSETSWLSGEEPLFLGMNHIVRFIPFSLILIFISLFLKNISSVRAFQNYTFLFFIIVLFCALWLASIFGNQTSLARWSAVGQANFLGWGLLFFLAAAGSVVLGKKFKKRILIELGIIFIILNFYTRYFEFGWELMHPTLFFACLGLSFWLIGKKAEKIWTISSYKKS